MKRIDLSRLQNAEHLALMKDLLELLKEASISVLAELKARLEIAIQQADLAQVQIRKSEHTVKLSILDKERDNIYRGLLLRVQSEAYSPSIDMKKAAEKVGIVVKTYGNFTTSNYQKETIEIQNFVADLKSEEYFPSVQKIGLEQWVEWLESANNAFNTLYTERRDEYAKQPSYNLKTIRKELDETFRKIAQTTEALEVLQPSEALTTLVAKVNVSIDKWKEILAQRKSNG